MFLVKTLNLDKGLTFPTTLIGLELGPNMPRAAGLVSVVCVPSKHTVGLLCHCTFTGKVSIHQNQCQSNLNQVTQVNFTSRPYA